MAILGLYDGLYGMWYPYYYPIYHPDYNPATPPFLYYYPYFNPFTPDYVKAIDAIRYRVSSDAILDYYSGVDAAVTQIIGKMMKDQSKAVADAAEASHN